LLPVSCAARLDTAIINPAASAKTMESFTEKSPWCCGVFCAATILRDRVIDGPSEEIRFVFHTRTLVCTSHL
jgi:hypothetical protein